jgi:hypothetical protein
MKFNELVRLLEENGFAVVKEKGSIRYYGKPGWDKLIRLDYHGFGSYRRGEGAAVHKCNHEYTNSTAGGFVYSWLICGWHCDLWGFAVALCRSRSHLALTPKLACGRLGDRAT